MIFVPQRECLKLATWMNCDLQKKNREPQNVHIGEFVAVVSCVKFNASRDPFQIDLFGLAHFQSTSIFFRSSVQRDIIYWSNSEKRHKNPNRCFARPKIEIRIVLFCLLASSICMAAGSKFFFPQPVASWNLRAARSGRVCIVDCNYERKNQSKNNIGSV